MSQPLWCTDYTMPNGDQVWLKIFVGPHEPGAGILEPYFDGFIVFNEKDGVDISDRYREEDFEKIMEDDELYERFRTAYYGGREL